MGCASSTQASNVHQPQSGAATNNFRKILDKYETFDELQTALRSAGLESSNLVLAVDYTKSNTWNGTKSFNNKCLHDIDPEGFVLNPYQSVISIVGRALKPFDDDNLIPAYGFGDSTTGGHGCFPFFPDGRVAHGFEQVLERYNQITPQLNLAGPTNFAPVINEAIKLCISTRGYHILIIVADGEVTNVKETQNAIIEATKYPLSIVMIGVGDGPWDLMQEFDDELPQRKFDNFQFVEFEKTMKYSGRNPEIGFATAALMEIPDQFKEIKRLRLL